MSRHIWRDFRPFCRIRGDEMVVIAVTRRKDSVKRLKRISEKRGRYRRHTARD